MRNLLNMFTAGLFVLWGAVASAQPVSILALGDSLTQGYGLIEQEGFVPQMRRWLAEQGAEVRLVNAGVSGDTTAGGAARVEWSLTPEIEGMIVALGGNDLLRGIAPEVARDNLERILEAARARDVSGDTTAGGAARVEWSLTPEIEGMIVALGGNDLLRGIAPEVARDNLERILEAARARDVAVLLVGMQAPGNYGADYKAEFDALYPELAAEYDTLLFESFFAGLQAAGGDDPAGLRGYFQSDGIHPNADGVALIVEAMGPAVLELVERARE